MKNIGRFWVQNPSREKGLLVLLDEKANILRNCVRTGSAESHSLADTKSTAPS